MASSPLSPDTLALYDSLAPAEQAALRAALAEDAKLRAAFDRWRAVRAAVRADLDAAVPDRHLFVLYALGEDDPALLSGDEAARVAVAKADLDAAVERYPGLRAAVRRVWADRMAFDAAWDELAEASFAEAAMADVQAETPTNSTVSTTSISDPAVKRRAADRGSLGRATTLRGGARWVWRISAAVAVAAFVAVAISILVRDSGFDTIQTVSGVTQVIELADGSTVELAENTTLMVAAADSDRSPRYVRLRAGTALFDVRESSEPFIVETTPARTTVLGTVFTVETTDAQTEVTLLSGAVELVSRVQPGQAVTLAPGQRSEVVGGDAPTAPERVDAQLAASWARYFYFEQTPLSVAAAELSAHYSVAIDVDEALSAETFTSAGSLERAMPVEDLLDLLARSQGARVEAVEGGYRLVP
ncbi:MAG: FecR family protein [Bacteroidota bacterium]